MSFIRIAWGILALAAAAVVIVGANASVAATNLSCSKSGTTGFDEYSCSDPITSVVGVWPFLLMGVALVGPALLAMVVDRAWLSWLAVLAIGGAAGWGAGHWASEWATLILGLPIAFLGAVVAAVQSALSLRASS
jgi:hypothetical protein